MLHLNEMRLHRRIINLVDCRNDENTDAAMRYLRLLERYAERHNMLGLADHANLAYFNVKTTKEAA